MTHDIALHALQVYLDSGGDFILLLLVLFLAVGFIASSVARKRPAIEIPADASVESFTGLEVQYAPLEEAKIELERAREEAGADKLNLGHALQHLKNINVLVESVPNGNIFPNTDEKTNLERQHHDLLAIVACVATKFSKPSKASRFAGLVFLYLNILLSFCSYAFFPCSLSTVHCNRFAHASVALSEKEVHFLFTRLARM